MGTKNRPNKLLETVSETKVSITKHACIVEAHACKACVHKRLVSTLPENHKDHIAEKGFNSISHNNLERDAPSNENPGCKGSSGEIMEESRNDSSVATEQSQE